MQNTTPRPPNGNPGIVPPWLQNPIHTLPMPEPEPKHVLNVTLLRSSTPITLRHGFVDAVLAAGAFA